MAVGALPELLRSLGFRASTIDVYALVLSRGPLGGAEIAGVVPHSDAVVEQAVEQLARLRLIGRDRSRARRRYYATNPFVAWTALEAEVTWQTDDSLASVFALPPSVRPDDENLQLTCAEIAKVASESYRPHDVVRAHRSHNVESEDEAVVLVAETVLAASRRVVALAKGVKLPGVSFIWSAIEFQLRRGVTYTRIVDVEEVIEHGLSVATRDMGAGVQLHVLPRQRIGHKFYLADDEVLMVLRDSSEMTAGSDARLTSSRHIVQRYVRRFEGYLAEARPGAEVVAALQLAADELALKAERWLSAEELLWYRSLVERGKFSRFGVRAGWDSDRLEDLSKRAVQYGLAEWSPEGNLVPAYPPQIETLLHREGGLAADSERPKGS